MKLRERTRSEATCGSFDPGHQLHWTHWKKASSAPVVPVSRVRMDGDAVELMLPGQPALRWRHHDTERLRTALRTARQPIVACPQFQALRIDGFWFNCAPVDAEFTLCG
jgi:hypothetical protein